MTDTRRLQLLTYAVGAAVLRPCLTPHGKALDYDNREAIICSHSSSSRPMGLEQVYSYSFITISARITSRANVCRYLGSASTWRYKFDPRIYPLFNAVLNGHEGRSVQQITLSIRALVFCIYITLAHKALYCAKVLLFLFPYNIYRGK